MHLQVILLVGTKLQVIITKMALRIQERGEVVKGTPVVQPGDDLFWFNRPSLILYLINFVLFQVLFQFSIFFRFDLINPTLSLFTYTSLWSLFIIAECLSACFLCMGLGKLLYSISLCLALKKVRVKNWKEREWKTCLNLKPIIVLHYHFYCVLHKS